MQSQLTNQQAVEILDRIGPVSIGTRGSPLALYQAHLVQRLLGETYGLSQEACVAAFPVDIFKTTGDVLKGRLSESGGKGLFVKELEDALQAGHVHIAVHSMKDVPTQRAKGLVLSAVLERADPRDGFISHKAKTLLDLPKGAILGTASLRRQAQALRVRPDLKCVLLRGNVGTRLKRLDEGMCDATFLAAAGLKRLGNEALITDIVAPEVMLNAPAQGAIGIETHENNIDIIKLISPLRHRESAVAISAERGFLEALDGNCRTPIAALAEIKGSELRFRGQALAPDGSLSFDVDETIALTELHISEWSVSAIDPSARNFGFALGRALRAEIGDQVIWDV